MIEYPPNIKEFVKRNHLLLKEMFERDLEEIKNKILDVEDDKALKAQANYLKDFIKCLNIISQKKENPKNENNYI